MSDTAQLAAMQVQAVPQHYIDASDLPTWGTADDGRRVRLLADVDLEADFAAWQAGSCKHEQQFTGKYVNAGGVGVFKRYCKACGIATTQHLPHRTIAGTTVTVIDNAKREKIIDKYVRYRRDGLEELATRAANRTQPDRRNEYAEYLNSAEWRIRRDSVMDRCDGLCEGCRQANAEDVHHLTYKHVGREFLFELVGLCRTCHTRWHEEEA